MTRLTEQIETTLPIDDVFAFIADFANEVVWDPATATSERIDAGPVGVGARYRLGVRMGGRVVPMEYRITTFEPPRRVILSGSGSGVTAVDEIRFEPLGTGTRVLYTADIRLGGAMRLIQPFLGGAFARLFRSGADGMQRALEARAAARATAPAPGGAEGPQR